MCLGYMRKLAVATAAASLGRVEILACVGDLRLFLLRLVVVFIWLIVWFVILLVTLVVIWLIVWLIVLLCLLPHVHGHWRSRGTLMRKPTVAAEATSRGRVVELARQAGHAVLARKQLRLKLDRISTATLCWRLEAGFGRNSRVSVIILCCTAHGTVGALGKGTDLGS